MPKHLFLLLLLLTTRQAAAQRCNSYKTSPRRHRYKLIKRQGLHIDTSVIKVNGVYIGRVSMQMQSRYLFVRFWSDGRCYMSDDYCSEPNASECDALNYGHYGQYRVDSNMVTIETFTSAGGYYYEYLQLTNDELTFKYTRSRVRAPNNVQPGPGIVYKYRPCVVQSQATW